MRETKIGMIQSPIQADLDRIAEDVVQYLNADMALLSVTYNTAVVSLGLSETVKRARLDRMHVPEDMACLQVMENDEALVLSDARKDPIASQTAYVQDGLVTGYIGVPIRNAEVGAIGALCGVTHSPRTWTDADVRYLTAISESVENLILREMYRLESLDATTLASEYDQISAAFALVRAEPTAIHDGRGRLVFANRSLTDLVDETELESSTFRSVLLRTGAEGVVRYQTPAGISYILTRLRTGAGYIVSQWRLDQTLLN